MRIKIGISSCLLGNQVRYDGGHKLDRFLAGTLGRYVDYVPVCPEVECGMPIPREPMRLEGEIEAPRLVTHRTREDKTGRMLAWADKRVGELAGEGLLGFIFKSDSPSCGMERVRVYDEKGKSVRKGVGLFARRFMEHFPLLPVEEEGRLHDPALRENFIERLFTMARWRDFVGGKPDRDGLVEFHARHKLLIQAHSTRHCREMGRLAAGGKGVPFPGLLADYRRLLMEALKLRATPKKNTNVLMHMAGHLEKRLTPDEKAELGEVLDLYRAERLPLVVPVTLIRHFVRKYDEARLRDEVYLNPHPAELQLRNHV